MKKWKNEKMGIGYLSVARNSTPFIGARIWWHAKCLYWPCTQIKSDEIGSHYPASGTHCIRCHSMNTLDKGSFCFKYFVPDNEGWSALHVHAKGILSFWRYNESTSSYQILWLCPTLWESTFTKRHQSRVIWQCISSFILQIRRGGSARLTRMRLI